MSQCNGRTSSGKRCKHIGKTEKIFDGKYFYFCGHHNDSSFMNKKSNRVGTGLTKSSRHSKKKATRSSASKRTKASVKFDSGGFLIPEQQEEEKAAPKGSSFPIPENWMKTGGGMWYDESGNIRTEDDMLLEGERQARLREQEKKSAPKRDPVEEARAEFEKLRIKRQEEAVKRYNRFF